MCPKLSLLCVGWRRFVWSQNNTELQRQQSEGTLPDDAAIKTKGNLTRL